MIVIIAMGLALFVVNVFVIPSFATMFQSYHSDLPLPTIIVIGVSDFFVGYWHLMLLVLIILVFSFRYYTTTEKGRYRWNALQLRIPLFGNILKRVLLTRFSSVFALVIRTDVPLTKGLELAASASDNAFMALHIRNMGEKIAHGTSIIKAATESNLFPPLVLQMLTVGEETGALDNLLDQIATFYQREVDYNLKKINDYIEPLLLLVIAVMVAVLALAIFLPMWNMAHVMTHGS